MTTQEYVNYTNTYEIEKVRSTQSYLADFSSAQTLLYVAIGLVGASSNFLVALVIIKTPYLRRRMINKFILNQTFLDIYVSLLLIAHSATNVSFWWETDPENILEKSI